MTQEDAARIQAVDQLSVLQFLHTQKTLLLESKSALIASITESKDSLSCIIPVPVLDAYLSVLTAENTGVQWEVSKLQVDMERLNEYVSQLSSPILRPMPVPMPGPSGPRGIR
jgi:hypothetical protein